MVYKINDGYYLTYGDRATDRRHKTWCKHYNKGKCTMKSGAECSASTYCIYYKDKNSIKTQESLKIGDSNKSNRTYVEKSVNLTIY